MAIDRTSDDTWQVVDRLFAAALDRPPAERKAWLETTAPDPELAREVLLLLESVEASRLPFESRDDGRLRGLWENLAVPTGEDPFVGTRVASYRLVRRLGSGGMGSVYLAEREGGEFEHRVAVKLLAPGFQTAEALERFRLERRILASLDHPNIAALFDGGATPAGQPFIVMEYVQGERITEHARDERLGLDEVLRLFLTVADAVEHAHRHLVVHRDIKPSNILVRPDGVVKLLDFGIARLLDDEVIDRTVTGSRVMTPAYASPEQFLGQAVTTATDVYQLGAVLRELLTGVPLFPRGLDARELERRIVEETPQRPSAVVRETASSDARRAGWSRRIRGDLDTIVLKAMRKEPERRYGSAGALAEDVRRYLERRPVTARPDTLSYRVRSTVRRHRWLAPVIAAAVLAAAMYVGTLVRYTRSLERERAVSGEVEAFVIGLFQPADPRRSDGATVTARELLEAGAERVERELRGQPELQVRLAQVIGEAFTALDDHAGARDVYAFRLATVRGALGTDGESYASALADLGVALANAGDLAGGDSLLTEALTLRRRLHGPVHELVGQTLLRRAVARTAQGDVAGANADFEAWLPIFRASPPEPDPEYLEGMTNLYWIRIAQGRRDEAVDVARSALELANRGFADSNPLVARYQALVANALLQQGRHDEVIEIGSRALATFEAASGGERSWEMISLLPDLAIAHERQERRDTAAALYRRAIELHTRLLGPGDASLIQVYQGLARIMSAERRYPEAGEAQSRALQIADDAMGGPNALSGSLQAGLAEILEFQGDTAAAAALYRTALLQLEGSRGWLPAKITARRRLAALARRDGRFDVAEEYLTGALEVTGTMQPPDAELQSAVLRELVDLAEAWRRPERAAEYRSRLNELQSSLE